VFQFRYHNLKPGCHTNPQSHVPLGHIILTCYFNPGAYRKITSLKEAYPHLKVLLSMGGWMERVEKNYSEVAESPLRRKAFVSSVSEFLR
jgi:GH18 family chitinase